jgi:hypothetical protein
MIRRIVLFGNSVIVGTVGASLRLSPQYEVVTPEPPLPGARELAALKPDVVLFDLEAFLPQAAFSLLESCPNLMLIGVSPDKNQVRMWTGRELKELSTQDLIKVINEESNYSTTL